MNNSPRPIFIFLLVIVLIASGGCTKIDQGLAAIDNAVNELKQINKTFDDIKNILGDTKDKLEKGEYKNQVDDLIGRTGQVSQLGVEGSIDFTRARVIEDLQNIKRQMLGQPPLARIPVLSNPQSPKIDFSTPSRSSLTIVGWNLDVAKNEPEKFKVSIENDKKPPRVVDHKYVSFQGQYSVTVNISSSGVPLEYYDNKLVFNGFDPLFEIAIVNSERPPPPEKIISVSGTIKTTNQDREGGFCMLELRDGETVVWRHIFPEEPAWGDRHSESFAFDNLLGPGVSFRYDQVPLVGGFSTERMVTTSEKKNPILVPANPKLFAILSQRGAGGRNILWRFEVKAEFLTDRKKVIRFEQTGLELRCGDGGPATVSTPVNLIR